MSESIINKVQSKLLVLDEGTLKSAISLLKGSGINSITVSAIESLLHRGCQDIQEMSKLLTTAQRLGTAQTSTIKNLRAVIRQKKMATTPINTSTTTPMSARFRQSSCEVLPDFTEDIAALVASMDLVRLIYYIEI